MTANPDRVPTDAELLAAVAEGDREAFGTLHDQHAPWLLVRLRQRTTNQDLADQVAQETFLVVWRDAGRFRGRGEVGAWIWGIAIRRLLDTQRGDAAQGRLAGLLGRRRIPDAVSAEEQALATLEHRDVIRALNRLAPELQAVLQATVLDGLSTREAAVLLGIPAGTVKTRARRALAMLLGGLRAGEVRALRLTDVDQGLRRLRVCGKGGRQRVVPVERAFFVELAAYLRVERPPRLATPECFVVLAGATAGAPLTEAGLRSVFRHHRQTSGAMRVRPHRLRHTYGTELAAAGIDLLVLRELMGQHVTPEMTLRYATLASPALRAAYDEAIGKARPRLPLIIGGRPAVPAKVEWLRSESLKTRVAHGYCARHLAQEACPYANICEQCDNFVPAPEFAPTLVDQLVDVQALQADAEQRGWTSEAERHSRVIQRLQEHLGRLNIKPDSDQQA